MLTNYNIENARIEEQMDQAERWAKKHHIEAGQPDNGNMLLDKLKKDAPE